MMMMMLEEAAVGGMIGRLLGVEDSNHRSILQGASNALRRNRNSKVEEEVKNE